MQSKGSLPRTNDLAQQPAVGDCQKKKGGGDGGYLADEVGAVGETVFQSLVTDLEELRPYLTGTESGARRGEKEQRWPTRT